MMLITFKKIVCLVTFLCLIPAYSFSSSLNLEERVVQHTFVNGLKVLIVERHQSPTVAAYIRFNVGSVDETTGETGTAHLLEHLLFRGTKTLGTKDFDKEKLVLDKIDRAAIAIAEEKAKAKNGDKAKSVQLQKQLKKLQQEHKGLIIANELSQLYSRNGAVGFNARTSADGTTYTVQLPSNKLELWAAIESDRMKEPVLRNFYEERDIVMEERRMRVENSATGKLYEQCMASAFSVHPYGTPVIGWQSDIQNLNRRATKKFLKTYYAPNNAVIGIVGNVNSEEVIQLIENYFGNIPPQSIPQTVSSKERKQNDEKRIEIIYDAEPQLLMGFHKPTLPAYDDYVFDVINSILGGGRSSRLYKSIVLQQHIAAQVGTSIGPGNRYPNLFIISGTPRYPYTVEDLEHAIEREINKLKIEPVSKRELQKVLNQFEAELIRGMKTNSGLASILVSFETLAGDWRYIIDHIEKVKQITPEDIMLTARKYFTEKNKTFCFITKKNES